MVGTTPYIKLSNVEVEYSDLVWGLRGVSFDILPGEFVFLVGPTGSGKSTVLKVLTREVDITRGQAIFDGQDLTGVGPMGIPFLRRKIGYVPQNYPLLDKKRVWENVGYAMRAVGATRREVRQTVPTILDQVNMGHRVDAYPKQLSGGEQQRVAIARALINRPKLLLFDEPTGNLDPDMSTEIMDLLLRLNGQGATVIVSSHDMPQVERVAKRIIRLERGQIVSDPGVGNV